VEEREQWEEIIRSKLKDFEVDTLPEDWKTIESLLPDKKVVFAWRWYYVAAAIALFFMIAGSYFYFNNTREVTIIAATGEAIDIYESGIRNFELGENAAIKKTDNNHSTSEQYNFTVSKTTETVKIRETASLIIPLSSLTTLSTLPSLPYPSISFTKNVLPEQLFLPKTRYIADATPIKMKKKASKRWTIGAGGGSYSVGTNGGGFANLSRSDDAIFAIRALNNGNWYMETPVRRNDNFNDFLANTSESVSEYNATKLSRVDIRHKQPISFGIGVGYALNNRWALQSGLVYTLLSSEWRNSLDFPDKYKQQLHFVGIPLGLSYKIAELNKFRFYTTAGVMAEWNVGGNIKTKSYYYEDDAYKTEKEFVRMKEMQWSVNMRIGANYPIIKFVNAYIEGGANYYFDNKSSIETIRSDKPFHVSLQAGFRFGF